MGTNLGKKLTFFILGNKELSYEDLKDTFIFDLRRAHGGFFIKNATFMNPALSVSFFANYV